MHVHVTNEQICYEAMGNTPCGQRMLHLADSPGQFICTRDGCYNITGDGSKTILAVTARDAGMPLSLVACMFACVLGNACSLYYVVVYSKKIA